MITVLFIACFTKRIGNRKFNILFKKWENTGLLTRQKCGKSCKYIQLIFMNNKLQGPISIPSDIEDAFGFKTAVKYILLIEKDCIFEKRNVH